LFFVFDSPSGMRIRTCTDPCFDGDGLDHPVCVYGSGDLCVRVSHPHCCMALSATPLLTAVGCLLLAVRLRVAALQEHRSFLPARVFLVVGACLLLCAGWLGVFFCRLPMGLTQKESCCGFSGGVEPRVIPLIAWALGCWNHGCVAICCF
jgi:hypothetical protein